MQISNHTFCRLEQKHALETMEEVTPFYILEHKLLNLLASFFF